MKTNIPVLKTTSPNTLAARLRTACATRVLPLLLLTLPAVVQAQYTYVTNDDSTATITGYTGDDGNLIIPGWMDDHKVTSIGDYAFFDYTSLTSVIITNSVTSIGNSAFYYCTSLTNVLIPNSVTNIVDNAFGDCESLTSIAIPNRLTSIGVWVFSDCFSLTNVTIPNSVTSIGNGGFANCSALPYIVIPSGVTNIGNTAFSSCSSLMGIYFMGNAPSYVDDEAFYNTQEVIVYYLPGTTNWNPLLDERTTELWNPQIQTSGASFGVRTNQFGFNISATNNIIVAVQACTNLSNPIWTPLQTYILNNSSVYFSDSAWKNYSRHFYRLGYP